MGEVASMTSWTAHLREGQEPEVIPEGFSWGALIFGPLWLLAYRAWIPAVLALAASILIAVVIPDPAALIAELGLSLLLGLSGHDLRRWAVTTRGYLHTNVLQARSETEALARLLDARPGLVRQLVETGR
jgi:hypothetical protein